MTMSRRHNRHHNGNNFVEIESILFFETELKEDVELMKPSLAIFATAVFNWL